MSARAVIGAALLFAALPALGETLVAECGDLNGVSVCTISEADLDKMIAANQRAKAFIEMAVRRIAELEVQKAPKCAEVEITEPSQNAPRKL